MRLQRARLDFQTHAATIGEAIRQVTAAAEQGGMVITDLDIRATTERTIDSKWNFFNFDCTAEVKPKTNTDSPDHTDRMLNAAISMLALGECPKTSTDEEPWDCSKKCRKNMDYAECWRQHLENEATNVG